MALVTRAFFAAAAAALTLASGSSGLAVAAAQVGDGVSSVYRFTVYEDPDKTVYLYEATSECFPDTTGKLISGEPYVSTPYYDKEYLGECYSHGPYLPPAE